MNKNEIKDFIRRKADEYNTKDFIKDDPIQFPRMFYDKCARIEDIEISAIISSWLAYGSRKSFMYVIWKLHEMMDWKPYSFIRRKLYDPLADNAGALYRFYKWSDLYALCFDLYAYYFQIYKHRTIGKVLSEKDDPLLGLIHMFDNVRGFPTDKRSACKRLNMLLRWMVRDDGVVDMGIWKLDKSKLIVPLDTHVHQTALRLGITQRKQADMKAAVEITDFLREVFPDDPTKGDFALYGLGLDNSLDLPSK